MFRIQLWLLNYTFVFTLHLDSNCCSKDSPDSHLYHESNAISFEAMSIINVHATKVYGHKRSSVGMYSMSSKHCLFTPKELSTTIMKQFWLCLLAGGLIIKLLSTHKGTQTLKDTQAPLFMTAILFLFFFKLCLSSQ